MGKIWFTADWHVGEQSAPNTHSFLRPRPTEVMVEEWLRDCHAKIAPEDTLVFLGDAIIDLHHIEVLRNLPDCSFKLFIRGDKEERFNHLAFDAECLSVGFDTVHNSYGGWPIGEHTFYLAHKPTDCLLHADHQPALCGHVHGIWRTQRMPNGQPIINVGIDAWGGLVSGEMIAHQYDCVTKGYYDKNCFPADW